MSNELRFDGRVALVTGAGNGLGRSHALLLASRGAKVVVNDLGGGIHGEGKGSAAADKVVEEIKAAGGQAAANYDSVEDGAKIVQTALDTFGRIDIVINNAGILRDVSFQKMSQDDWDLIYRVHVLGAFRVTQAAWNPMREQGYGRIVMTASAAGIYGNFGQSNYSMAKLGIHGFTQTLALEGGRKNVHVNSIAPIAGSRMTETVLPPELLAALKPEYVSPLVAYLCHESCEDNGALFEVGGGFMGKLRWERSSGTTFRLGRAVTPEQVQKSWEKITGFDQVTHPLTIADAMKPVMDNVQAGPARGGNDLIDVDLALGYEFPSQTSGYDERDLSIYALGVGAAANALDESDLRFVYELHKDGFQALPTYAVAPALGVIFAMAKEGIQAPGMSYGLDRILHGEQYTEVKRPLPPKAKLTHKAKIKDIFDKGKNALVVTAITSTDETGEVLAYNEITTFVRGAGGWGGDRGPSSDVNVAPDRAPDASITEKISDNQALLYRLSGDWNPLHADPGFATMFGFPRPILHGLCTFGYAGRHVIKAMAGNDPRLFKSIKVRFSDTVFPGETVTTEMWKESDTRVIFRCKVKERDKVVISNAAVELYKEIPKAVEKPRAAVAAAAPAAAPSAPAAFDPASVTSAEVFAVIADHLKRNPEMAGKIATVYQFQLTGPDSTWTVDLKTAPGSVSAGETQKPDCTLTLSDADFVGMTQGKADPQKLYFGGKLKIAGNLMASQKLEFLKKIPPEQGLQAILASRGGKGGGAPATAAAPAPAAPAPAAAPAGGGAAAFDPASVTSAEVFAVIADHLKRNPEMAGKIATVYQFQLTGPDSTWTVDLKTAPGSVSAGETQKPDCTLTLSDADFVGMTQGKADPQKLYFGGKLKIAGNLMASQKLEFLKKIPPEQGLAAIMASRGASAPAAAPAAAAPAAAAPAKAAASGGGAGGASKLFDKLRERFTGNTGLSKEVNAVVAFKVTAPEGAWLVDCTQSPGQVSQGEGKAAATVTIADEELAALAGGAAPQVLFQQGKLKVDGEIRAAQRLLQLFKGLA